ncbi:MAG TPA: hypothetical protein VK155_15665 [Bacteroidales bacterium]|jgi:hypothetical protein|nr:hypothetical protein [Bacteroidales bacterium]
MNLPASKSNMLNKQNNVFILVFSIFLNSTLAVAQEAGKDEYIINPDNDTIYGKTENLKKKTNAGSQTGKAAAFSHLHR